MAECHESVEARRRLRRAREQPFNRGCHDGAAVDRDDAMRSDCHVSERSRRGAMHLCAVAGAEGRRGLDLDALPLDPPGSSQGLPHDRDFLPKLLLVADVQPVASPACPGVAASGRDTVRGRLDDLHECRPLEVPVPLVNPHLDALAGQHPGNEHRLAVQESKPLPAGDELDDRKLAHPKKCSSTIAQRQW